MREEIPMDEGNKIPLSRMKSVEKSPVTIITMY
jgi:hypothetical protein